MGPTPDPERGPLLAAAAVVLTVLAALLDLRFGDTWAAGVRFVVIGALAALVGMLAVRLPVETVVPRPAEAVLHVTTFLLALLALGDLADALGANSDLGSAGTLVWVGMVLALLGAWFALRRRSPVMTLLGAAAGAAAALAFVRWAFDPDGLSGYRWMLLVSAVALGLGAVALRDRARRHAVALVDVAGLSVVALGLTLLVATVLGLLTPSVLGFTAYAPDPGGPAGWELVLLACGLGLVAYGAVDRERVPAFLGALALVLFALVASPDDHPSLVGWPLLLALAGGALLVAGLRPRPPAPPEPGVPAAPPTAPTAVVGAHAAEGGGPA